MDKSAWKSATHTLGPLRFTHQYLESLTQTDYSTQLLLANPFHGRTVCGKSARTGLWGSDEVTSRSTRKCPMSNVHLGGFTNPFEKFIYFNPYHGNKSSSDAIKKFRCLQLFKSKKLPKRRIDKYQAYHGDGNDYNKW